MANIPVADLSNDDLDYWVARTAEEQGCTPPVSYKLISLDGIFLRVLLDNEGISVRSVRALGYCAETGSLEFTDESYLRAWCRAYVAKYQGSAVPKRSKGRVCLTT